MRHLLLAGTFVALAAVGTATKSDPPSPEPEIITAPFPEGPRVIHLEPIPTPPELNWGDRPFTEDMIIKLSH